MAASAPSRRDPDRVERSREERAKVGAHCEVHSWARLRLDLVPIQYGIVGCTVAVDHERFPNARVCASGGCVVGRHRQAEVAYCPQCRGAFYRAHPQYLLHPIRPYGG